MVTNDEELDPLVELNQGEFKPDGGIPIFLMGDKCAWTFSKPQEKARPKDYDPYSNLKFGG